MWRVGPFRNRGVVAEQPQHWVVGTCSRTELVDPRTVQGAAVPLLGRHPDWRSVSFWPCRQGLIGRRCSLAQLLGWRQHAVAPMGGLVRTLGRGLKPGNRRDAPAKVPPQRLLGLTSQVADLAEDLGVSLLPGGDAFGEGSPFASHPASPPF